MKQKEKKSILKFINNNIVDEFNNINFDDENTKTLNGQTLINKKLNNKQEKGQFMTTNYEYILQGLHIPENVNHIIEPFCGKCDLLNFIKIEIKNIELYDIESQTTNEKVIIRDTILHPPSFNNKFVLTNPPYLARNKCKNKEIFDRYDVNDLYKAFIKILINDVADGGIIILPLNFWSSIRKCDILLRKYFLQSYTVNRINVFEEKVFDDTTYAICSFLFHKKEVSIMNIEADDKGGIPIIFFPSKKSIIVNINKINNYTIGGEIYNLKQKKNEYHITRITNKNINNEGITNIFVKCIDNNGEDKLGLSFIDDKDIYIDNTPNFSARSFASLIIASTSGKIINKGDQKKIILFVNEIINDYRNKYNSLFLCNYRENKDIARKRISFDLVYNLVGYVLENKLS